MKNLLNIKSVDYSKVTCRKMSVFMKYELPDGTYLIYVGYCGGCFHAHAKLLPSGNFKQIKELDSKFKIGSKVAFKKEVEEFVKNNY